MAIRECSVWYRWSTARRRRVLDIAAREQAREHQAARMRLLTLAEDPGS